MRLSLFEMLRELARRHWLLILIVLVAGLAGGYLYTSRQRPVYEADTQLKIVRGTVGRASGGFEFSFEEDQAFYNTQYMLLKTQLEWADQALDRAAWLILDRLGLGAADPESAAAEAVARLGPTLDESEVARIGAPAEASDFPFGPDRTCDPRVRRSLDAVRRDVLGERWGLTPDVILASVRAEPVPGTYLARLSYNAGDPGIAVFLVNLYAELYRDVSREERKEAFEDQVNRLGQQREESNDKWEKAQEEFRAFRSEHPDLWLGERLNIPQQEATALSSRIHEQETEFLLRESEEANLRSVLGRAGIDAAVSPEGLASLSVRGEQGAPVNERLAKDARILGLAMVESDPGVTALGKRLEDLERERAGLPLDLTEENARVRLLRERLAEAQSALGRQVEAVVLDYLEAGARARQTTERLRERLAEKQAASRTIDEQYARLEELSSRIEVLRAEKESLDRGYATLSRLFEQSGPGQVPGRLSIENIRLERRARIADARQIRPNKALLFALSVLGALLLGLGIAWLREYFDDTVKTKADFERFISLPEIGCIPRIGGRDPAGKDLVTLEQPKSEVAEAFRAVRTGILFSRRDEEIRSLLVSSATPGEGKTTVATNLAITMAQADRGRVLLVDTDLRRARIHSAFSLDNQVGLTNCLVGSADLASAVRETPVKNLFVLTAGPTPPNPAELLGGRRMAEMLQRIREEYGKVVLDAPPILPVTDACVLATLVDGVFLVVSLGQTSWRLVKRAQETLKAVGVDPAGAILNCVRGSGPGQGYRYQYEDRR